MKNRIFLKNKKTGNRIEIEILNSEKQGFNFDYVFREHHQFVHHSICEFSKVMNRICSMFHYDLM